MQSTTGWLYKSGEKTEARYAIKITSKRGTGDNREQRRRRSTRWRAPPASCHPMKGRLRLTNCLPRWAPTGSLSGSSHAKWLQRRGWYHADSDHNKICLVTLSESQWLSANSDQSHSASTYAAFWTTLYLKEGFSICVFSSYTVHLNELWFKLFARVEFSFFLMLPLEVSVSLWTRNRQPKLKTGRWTASELISLDLLAVRFFWCQRLRLAWTPVRGEEDYLWFANKKTIKTDN